MAPTGHACPAGRLPIADPTPRPERPSPDTLDQKLVDYAQGVVELCASIGDQYTLDHDDRDAGEHIRAALFDYPLTLLS